MSTINPISGNNPVYKTVTKPAAPTQSAAPAQAPARTDKLELGDVQQYLTHLKSNDIRMDKVQQIKQQIADGTYESDEKINGAIDKLLDDVV